MLVIHFKEEYKRPPITYRNVIDVRCIPNDRAAFLVISMRERPIGPITKVWWNIGEISQITEE